jgi:hypothetical protein
MRAFAQHRLSQIEPLTHGGFHFAAMHFVKGMNGFGHGTLLQHEPTVTGGSMLAQSMVPSLQRKKIYCKAIADQ